MNADVTRRQFLGQSAALAAGVVAAPHVFAQAADAPQGAAAGAHKFEISLAAWSVHKLFYEGKLKQIDMPELCRKEFDIHGLELVNSFFPSPQYSYCQDLLKRAGDNGVKVLLIMCDGEGDMAHADKTERMQAVRNHRKWVDIAKVLGCHSIRCNAGNAKADDTEAIKRCADSFAQLCEYAQPDGLNVIIENHWGLSSDPDALLAVIKAANTPVLGTLPDFGNFPDNIDRYDAVRKMMPFAKAVSAKCYDFNAEGNETRIDYAKMMEIVLAAGYHHWVGIEYEGKVLDELAGVKACKKLLERFQ